MFNENDMSPQVILCPSVLRSGGMQRVVYIPVNSYYGSQLIGRNFLHQKFPTPENYMPRQRSISKINCGESLLDRLEKAGRVPSKEKFRRMVCNVSD